MQRIQLNKKENQDGSYEEYAYNENGALSFISKHECCASKTCLQATNIEFKKMIITNEDIVIKRKNKNIIIPISNIKDIRYTKKHF